MPIIEVDQITKEFSGQVALNKISFSVQQGEVFGLVGPSGAGKTTLLQLLTGQVKADTGQAKVLGHTTNRLRGEQLQEIGIMTDNSGLYDRLSIYDNLKLYCRLYGCSLKRVEEVLMLVHLGAEQKKKVQHLSKGMRQRVLLARALLHEPQLLFLDEPTSALDPMNTYYIHQGLRTLNQKGTTIFLTTHDMREAEVLCHRVAFLHEGKLPLMGSPIELRERFSDATVTVRLTGREPMILQNGPEDAQKMYDYFCSNQIVTIHSNEPTLDEIFIHVTGRGLV